MKQPRIILEWDCGGIGCTKIVQVETDAALSSLTDAALQLIAEGGGLPHPRQSDLLLPDVRRSEAPRA